MNQNKARCIALFCAVALMVSFTACKKVKKVDETVPATAAETTLPPASASEAPTERTTMRGSTTGKTTARASAPKTVKKRKTSAKKGTKSTSKEKVEAGTGIYKNSSDKAVVLKAYKNSCNATGAIKTAFRASMLSMTGVDPSKFPEMDAEMNEENNEVFEGLPGDYTQLTGNDLSSASMKVDGTQATLILKGKEQEADAGDREETGPVGRLVGVIEGGWKEETDPPDFKAQYKKPVVSITVDLTTGKIRRGTASYEVHMSGTVDGEGGNRILIKSAVKFVFTMGRQSFSEK